VETVKLSHATRQDCQILLSTTHVPKRENIYQIAIKHTKLHFKTLQGTFTQIRIFVLQICHLATLPPGIYEKMIFRMEASHFSFQPRMDATSRERVETASCLTLLCRHSITWTCSGSSLLKYFSIFDRLSMPVHFFNAITSPRYIFLFMHRTFTLLKVLNTFLWWKVEKENFLWGKVSIPQDRTGCT
jgi:hypothetical protein